ncbi:hypothetical protein D3C86_1772910 [compost metagenome]
MIDQPRQQSARIASRVGDRRGHDAVAVERQFQCRVHEREIFLVWHEFAHHQRPVVQQVGQLGQGLDLRPGGKATGDEFDGGGHFTNPGQHFFVAVVMVTRAEGAVEAKGDLQFQAHRRISATVELAGGCKQAVPWQG